MLVFSSRAVFVVALLWATPVQQEPVSIEQLLSRAKAAQSQAQAPLVERVGAILNELATPDLRDSALKSLSQELLAMGAPAGPLLVPALDPSEDDKSAAAQRADRLEPVLVELQDLGTTLALLDAATGDNPRLARRALRVLRSSPHDRIVAEALVPKIDWNAPLDKSRPFLRTISALSGKGASLPLHQALETSDRARVVAALQALTMESNRAVASDMLAALKAMPEYSVLLATVRYFQAVPDGLTAGEDLRVPYLQLARPVRRPPLSSLDPWERTYLGTDLPLPAADLVVDLLSTPLDIKATTALRELLWDWVDSRVASETSLLVLLAKTGDGKAKKRYLEASQQAVQDSRREDEDKQASALAQRARAYLDIGEAADAIRDGLKALKLCEKKAPSWPVRQELAITMGTAQALRGRWKDAADYLESAGLNAKQRAELRSLPAFAEFLESRYGYILAP
ncbi:MAG: hypothetical protein H6829_13025 [Planctomycetes bacterium]|nr:hypothetical protein [Planctomycetota bacterium]MCB9912981.1 hypothetical protein [Planctomycetota bacterium]HPF14152.1 hypothetical protein [Planctomycetota bacterium]